MATNGQAELMNLREKFKYASNFIVDLTYVLLDLTCLTSEQLAAMYDDREKLKEGLSQKIDTHSVDGKALYVLQERVKKAISYIQNLAYALLTECGLDKSEYEVLIKVLDSLGIEPSNLEYWYDGKIKMRDGVYWFEENID